MSQQNSQQLYPSLPPPYIYQSSNAQNNEAQKPKQQQVVVVESVNTTVSPTQPLLPQQVVYYPVYHPQRVVHYAKRSKRNCCCVFWGVTCCCFLLIGAIIGGALGYLAWKCSQLDVSVSNTYTVQVFNATRLSFSAQDGDYSFQERTDGVNNVTVVITRKTSDENSISQFTTSLTNEDGQVVFSDSSSVDSWWNFVTMFCIQAQVSVLIPPGNYEIYVSNTNGDVDIVVNTSSHYANFTVFTVNGDLDIGSVNASSLSAQSTNGDVNIQNSLVDNLSAFSTNGDVNVEDTSVSTNVNASTTNGDVYFSSLFCSGTCNSLNFGSINGDINVYMYNFGGNFVAQANQGDVIVTGSNIVYVKETENYAQGTIQGGTGNFDASTSNGDITVGFY